MSIDDFAHPVITAVKTQFVTARAVAQRMVEQGSGVIMSIEGLWRSLASELGPHGVRLVILRSAGSPDAPGLRDALTEHAGAAGKSLEEFVADMGRSALLRRLPLLTEIANAATLFASDRASALTGAIANVTCGALVDL